MIALTLLTRPGCHLCETMKEVITRAPRQYRLSFTEVDITHHPDLEKQFGTQIPVLLHDDRVIARYRVTVTELCAALSMDQTDPPVRKSGE